MNPISALRHRMLHCSGAEPQEHDETTRERVATDTALRLLAPVAAPENLQLRLRLALSHERVRAERRWTGRVLHHVETFVDNRVRPIAVQVAVATVALVMMTAGAAMLGAFAPQQTVEANDVPLSGFSAPQYLYSQSGAGELSTLDDAPLVVQANVNAEGRVYDYRVLSGLMDDESRRVLRDRLVSGVFHPAEVFGTPVPGTVVLTFSDVSVKG